MKLNLTDQEWLLLIDSTSDDSELGSCCANVSALRDVIIDLVINGVRSHSTENHFMINFMENDLKQKLVWYASSHELSPLIQKICDQLNFDPSKYTNHLQKEFENGEGI